ncbi:hypothetical protein DPEC_G00036980 [Dallia pectoralis]|uniref:Uncharacterized protein n=1 Tax=Dallia pectoralis TaxID=75939 RepID=A0ACC2HE62_DALPE|nr:hypothetical protein DPEC_G00036980 [Dallia pectoralis]
MNRLQRKLMSMQNTLYLILTAKRETYPISCNSECFKQVKAEKIFVCGEAENNNKVGRLIPIRGDPTCSALLTIALQASDVVVNK